MALWGTLIVIATLGALPLEIRAQVAQATVTVESAQIPEGQQKTIAVTVADAPGSGLVSFQGSMEFDPTVIAVIGVEFPDNFEIKASNIEESRVRFAATTTQEGVPVKDGVLFTLTLQAVGAAGSSTTLSPTFEIFHDLDFNPIEHAIVAGVITIISSLNEPPTADFDFTPTSPTTQDTIQFHDRSSDPDGEITSWLWDFGDDTQSEEQSPTHRYPQAGTYTVTLTVTDDLGATATVSKQVIVVEAAPLEVPTVINFPNPARSSTTFRYSLPVGTTQAALLVFNLVGRPVLARDLNVNENEFRWDLRDERGNALPNGPYFYLVRAVTSGGVVRSRVEVLFIQR